MPTGEGAQFTPAAEAYTARPWLKHYPTWVSADLSLPYNNGLEMFQHTASTLPDQAAVYYFDQIITFGEVDRQSTTLATAILEQGIQRGDRIALFMQNIPQFLIAVYGIWKAGGIVVLCSPMFKHKELEYHLKDSGARGLICLEALYLNVAAETIGNTAIQFVITTNELDYLGNQPIPAILQNSKKSRCAGTLDWEKLLDQYTGKTITLPDLGPDDIAFLTYTSGTTGQPKGAMNTHGNLVYNAQVFKTWMQLDRSDVVIGVAPFFHITGLIAHIAVAALVGLPIITFYRFEAGEMLRLVEKWHGSFTVAAITVYIALLNFPDLPKFDLSSMKKLFSGGAPVSPFIVDDFYRASGAYIHNIYGLTETTSPSHAVPLGEKSPVDPDSGALSIGLPVPGTISRVVDLATGEDLPVGEVGELIIKGPQIVPGYWHKPEESANAIRDTYLYTGDVAKMDHEGWYYLVDRKKDMIIASGFKVWPREVEDVLYQHPAVREAGVVGVADAYRGETVKAFVALKPGYEQNVTPEELIAFCKERMASYKYPREIEFLDELPKTLTGKYLRRELRSRNGK
jgi:long-chain acyl-CoA synthetase